jgi:rhodanese-related sulfurtransferase
MDAPSILDRRWLTASLRQRNLSDNLATGERRLMATSVKELLATANAAVPRIAQEDAAALIAKGEALVVDVRDAPELQAGGKIPGALNVSRGMLEFRADPDSPYHDPAFDRSRTVLLYCASGGRSALAGKTLQDLGYRDVRNLGAFKDWVEKGGSVERV